MFESVLCIFTILTERVFCSPHICVVRVNVKRFVANTQNDERVCAQNFLYIPQIRPFCYVSFYTLIVFSFVLFVVIVDRMNVIDTNEQRFVVLQTNRGDTFDAGSGYWFLY